VEQFYHLIQYFRDYELYDNMLSNELKDKQAQDVLLERCDHSFIRAKMLQNKNKKILSILQKKLDKKQQSISDEQIRLYVDDEISLEELITSIPLINKLYEEKSKVQKVKHCNDFCVFYPIYLKRYKRETSQQPLLTFNCTLTENDFDLVKLYINKDILALIIATQHGLEVVDARAQYAKQLDELSAAVDTLQGTTDFMKLYEMVSHHFMQIMKTKLDDFHPPEHWQLLDKATISFEPINEAIGSCFYNELETLRSKCELDGNVPPTVQRFLGLSKTEAINIEHVKYSASHMGSYQCGYPINQKQWEIMQLSKQSKLLCVDGPPGTGKTTLLKEMIAEELVLKAAALLDVWEQEWICLEDDCKGLYRPPFSGENIHSVVISSTNNKAIDNIGLELLSEIEYFSGFADTITSDGYDYKGILCARLGRSENVKNFYDNIYEGFCEYLSEADVSQEEMRSACEQYRHLQDKLCNLNDQISALLLQREKFPQFSSYSDIHRSLQVLDETLLSLRGSEVQLESQLASKRQQHASLKQLASELERSQQVAQQEVLRLETHIRVLYTDLQEYENIGWLRRVLRFLFPKTDALLKRYGSAQQIKDEIQLHREAITKKQRDNEALASKIVEIAAELDAICNAEKALQTQLADVGCEVQLQGRERKELASYCHDVEQLYASGALGKDEPDFFNTDVYGLRNLPVFVQLRHQLFTTSLRVFETYIKLHKEPILHNLKQVLKTHSTYYNWPSIEYLHAITEENKQTYIRNLWETFFLCFPVVTTTLHAFQEKTFAFLPELIDVLLLDESGQVIPYYAVAPLYRAKRAVFVGDVHQIEPIKSVPRGLLQSKYLPLLGENNYAHFCIDEASAQSYAAKASDYMEIVGEQAGGVILNEHRRCEQSIMEFSNRHIYQNALRLIEDDDQHKLFNSNLIAFDVRGFKDKEHYNQAEIDACKKIVDMLIARYGEKVREEVGIITPFSRQAEKLKQAIHGIDNKAIGTVHVFQGAEKKYILFSSVLDDTAKSRALFQFVGGKGNLLNVAFSRAKKQFIFIGNFQAAKDSNNYLKRAMDVLAERGSLFSLFDSQLLESNPFLADKNIIHILTGEQSDTTDEIGTYLHARIPEGIIAEPSQHNVILNDMIRMTEESLHIISPWIGSNVVTENMIEAIEEKVMGNVPIHITFGHKAVDCSLDDIDTLVARDIPWRKESAASVIRALQRLLGNRLRYSPPSHVKLMLVDNRYLFIGSLNWLFNSGKTEQKEISCLITNPNTIAYVKERFLPEQS